MLKFKLGCYRKAQWGRNPARIMGHGLWRWQKGNWGRDGWASNKAGTRQRDLSGRQMGPSEAKGPHVSESPLIFPSKSWSPFAYDMWDPAASPRGSRRTLTQEVRLIVVVLWFIMKTLNYFQIKLRAFNCFSYWSSKIQQKMFVERLK